ncbi:NAD(P)-dependent oxidoreductase [Nocardia transvalensis]|uniref:NAD(P)-dependent oxidoreductase n=1 Tax=Nocardia transvalensis TaxID=37333 RepID=UPI001895AE2C|nr:NAD(P)-dependent oxidoreductase [Nocardia transvalensis]MBF6331927.1 hypothetical protein [Nocardia transvalensis]
MNTARGALIDQDALAAALETKALAGAALDVFDPEPPATLHLLQAPNVLLSAHTAGITRETMVRITQAVVDNVTRFAAGRPPHDVVPERQRQGFRQERSHWCPRCFRTITSVSSSPISTPPWPNSLNISGWNGTPP